jgi:hypothetical protein
LGPTSREGREALLAAQGRAGSGEQDRTPPARQHHPRRLAPRQETGETGHLPDLGKHLGRGLDDAEAHVRADIEDHHLQRPDLTLDLVEQGDHLGLLAGVDAIGAGLAAAVADRPGEDLELIQMARPAGHADRVALGGEGPGDRPADAVADAHHQACALLCRGHPPSPLISLRSSSY